MVPYFGPTRAAIQQVGFQVCIPADSSCVVCRTRLTNPGLDCYSRTFFFYLYIFFNFRTPPHKMEEIKLQRSCLSKEKNHGIFKQWRSILPLNLLNWQVVHLFIYTDFKPKHDDWKIDWRRCDGRLQSYHSTWLTPSFWLTPNQCKDQMHEQICLILERCFQMLHGFFSQRKMTLHFRVELDNNPSLPKLWMSCKLMLCQSIIM